MEGLGEYAGSHRKCPECDAAVPVDMYGEWCELCNWNVDREPPLPLKPRQERARARVRARSDRLFQQMVAEGLGADRRFGVARLASYALAVVVLLISLIPLAGGVMLVTLDTANVFTVSTAVFLALVTVVVFPRSPRMSRDAVVLRRDEAPALYGIVDELTHALGTAQTSEIAVDAQFNASTTSIGLMHRRAIIIGLPLWDLLSPQERVATLAHEIGHDLGGDLGHTALVSRSLSALRSWYALLRPSRVEMRRAGYGSALSAVILLVLSGAVGQVARLQAVLVRRASPRAEYRADEAAASVASSSAMCSALDQLVVGDHAAVHFSRAVSRRDSDPWEATRASLAAVPPREKERRRRLSLIRRQAVDPTHPPTVLRIELLQRLPARDAKVVMNEGTARAIEAELAPARSRLVAMSLSEISAKQPWWKRRHRRSR